MFRLLRRISAQPEISITDLAQLVGLDRSTLGRNLRVLEKQGLVRLSVAKAERARHVSRTKPGRDALTQAIPLWHVAQTQMKQAIGSDLDTLIASLADLSKLSAPNGETSP